jgi:Winged helix-turn-helix DNA-binding
MPPEWPEGGSTLRRDPSDDLPYWIFYRVDRGPEGRPIITDILIRAQAGAEITARGWRQIPVGRLIPAAELAAVGWHESVALRRSKDLSDREWFETIAVAYRNAYAANPHTPVKELASRVGRSEGTVRRWLQRCRDMGLLRPAPPGRAGERPEETNDGK